MQQSRRKKRTLDVLLAVLRCSATTGARSVVTSKLRNAPSACKTEIWNLVVLVQNTPTASETEIPDVHSWISAGSKKLAVLWHFYHENAEKFLTRKKVPKALLCKFPIVTPKTNHVFRTRIGKICEAKPWYFSIRACSFRKMACRRATLGTSE